MSSHFNNTSCQLSRPKVGVNLDAKQHEATLMSALANAAYTTPDMCLSFASVGRLISPNDLIVAAHLLDKEGTRRVGPLDEKGAQHLHQSLQAICNWPLGRLCLPIRLITSLYHTKSAS